MDDSSSRWQAALARQEGTPARCAPQALRCVRERYGLEIGGPSAIFARDGKIPVYTSAARIDNVVFASQTMWHDADTGGRFDFDAQRTAGRQLVLEGSTLPGVQPGSYQFILSSHVLEHLANPIQALRRWQELLVRDGHLLLVVPHRDRSFDRHRPVTRIEHLLADAATDVGEDDMTHAEEALALHDYEWGQGTDRRQFQEAVRDNLRRRSLHHHVFDTELVGRLLDLVGFQLLALEPAPLFHIIALAQVSSRPPANADFLGPAATWRHQSPFPSDRNKPRAYTVD